jgi:hypothetical protein
MTILTHGIKGDKEILISQISSIQMKRAGLLNGYIQFAFLGGTESRGGVLAAAQDENTVLFSAAQQPAFEALKTEIDRRRQALLNPQANTQPRQPHSVADELEKLAALLSKGILTREEFEAQKRLVLSR